MSIPENASKVATSAIDAMKTNPSCLAALLVVALFAVLQYFEDSRQSERMEQRVVEVGKLLNMCFQSLESGKRDRP
jgi:hypothetical protein